MLKEFAWMTFENTGSIDAYVFYKEIEDKNLAAKEKTIAEEEAASTAN